jgi:hypothetical protein
MRPPQSIASPIGYDACGTTPKDLAMLALVGNLYDLPLGLLYPLVIVLIAGAGEFGHWLARRFPGARSTDLSTLTGAGLGLLALLLGFSFSLALSRFDARRTLVLEEANAIGSTANFALMLPSQAQKPILTLLREYTALRIHLGVPYDPVQFDRDVDRSVALQGALWQAAVAVSASNPQSLPAYRFIGSLNEVNNIHESRVTALRYHVPGEVLLMLLGVAMLAIGLTGVQAGAADRRGRIASLLMSITIASVMVLIVDLDQPARGLIRVSVQPLIEAANGMPP